MPDRIRVEGGKIYIDGKLRLEAAEAFVSPNGVNDATLIGSLFRYETGHPDGFVDEKLLGARGLVRDKSGVWRFPREAIGILSLIRKDGPTIYSLQVGACQAVEITPFTDEEKTQAESLENQLLTLEKQAGNEDLESQVKRQAFELILASAKRANPNVSTELLHSVVARGNFSEVWKAVRQTMGAPELPGQRTMGA